MKLVTGYLRTLVVSPEFAVVVLCTYLALFQPSLVERLNSFFEKDAEPIKWLALVPSAIFVWTLTLVRKIRFPENDKKAELQQWRYYGKLVTIANIALFYGLLFACGGILAWISDTLSGSVYRGLLLSGSVVGALFVGGSCYMAEMTINHEFGKRG